MNLFNKLEQNIPTIELAAKHIHLELLQIIQSNIEGTKIGEDPEYLHRLRIAIRKTRSALSLIPDVFPAQKLHRFQEEFSWLQKVTGTVRDVNVHLLALQDYQQNLSFEQIEALRPVKMILEQQQKIAQYDMNKELNSSRVSNLLLEWTKALEINIPATVELKNQKLLKKMVNASLYRLHKIVIKKGKGIDPDSSDEALHNLRKRCKKLRYLLEFFQNIYNVHVIKHVIKIIKHLTDELGICQDLSVQTSVIKTINAQMLVTGLIEPFIQEEIDNLLTNIKHRHLAAKMRSIDAFIAIDSVCERHLFRTMLDSNSTINY